jgi:hypothetical protein
VIERLLHEAIGLSAGAVALSLALYFSWSFVEATIGADRARLMGVTLVALYFFLAVRIVLRALAKS